MQNLHREGPPHPMVQVFASERALADRLGVVEAPYVPPAERFYHSNYILDGCVAAELCIKYGYHRKALKQLTSFQATQRPDGMIPGVSHPPTGFSINPERWLSTVPFEGNDYTQTPDIARVALLLHEAASTKNAVSAEESINPDVFIEDIYPYLRRYYLYFINKRQVAEKDPRVFQLHPHEDNRDSAPEHDEWKRQEIEKRFGKLAVLLDRIPRTGEHMPTAVNHYNRAVDYVGAIAINYAGWRAGWDPARIHETAEYVDVWFNCHLVENYAAMGELAARLGRVEDAAMFTQLSVELEQQILAKHYDPAARSGDGGVYSVFNEQFQKKEAIGNLAILLLPNLPEPQLRSTLLALDKSYDAPFVVPCVAIDDIAHFDPHYEEKNSHWKNGAVWGEANAVIKRGLDKHIDRDEEIPEVLRNECWEWFHRIDASGHKLVEINNDFAESYSQITGLGQRMARTRGHIFGAAIHLPA